MIECAKKIEFHMKRVVDALRNLIGVETGKNVM